MVNGRILYIFTPKSIITTTIGIIIGLVFYYIFGKVLSLTWLGVGFIAFFALIGYGIATLKMPDTNTFEITRKTGGERLDDILIRAFKFKNKGKRIYLYTKEEFKK